jgi:antitoxin component YwqK of YwqJK toxin-antitoxin module
VESDTNLNGKLDTWEYYRNGKLSRIEKDDEGDGTIGLKIFFKNGKKQKLIRDKDYPANFSQLAPPLSA